MIAFAANQFARGRRIVQDTARFLGELGTRGRLFDYDAADSSRNRKTRSTSLKSEDRHLPPQKRQALTAKARENARNFVVAAWAVRKHLDWVTSFRFQARTKDRGFNRDLQQFVEWWGRAANFDVAGRHGLRRYLRIAEARRTLDGDFFTMKLDDGTVQGIEGDRIRSSTANSGEDLSQFYHGVRTNKAGRALAYALSSRTDTGFLHERIIPARHLIPVGYYDRIDQTRGISPFAPALNGLQDVYEGFDYALAKAKLAQLIGLVIYSDAKYESMPTVDAADSDGDGETDDERYEVQLGEGPFKLELDGADRAEFIDPKTPSSEFKDYSMLMLQVALKALDIPYSFFDESFTNFYGSKGGILQYIHSCRPKRADLLDFLGALTAWRLAIAVTGDAPEIRLPRTMEWVDLAWEWIPSGARPWDRHKEAQGVLAEIRSGTNSPQDACQELDRDYYANVDKIKEAMEYAAEAGVPLEWAVGATTT